MTIDELKEIEKYIEEYIQDKQRIIDEFLKYEKENGFCYVDKGTIENNLKISRAGLNEKIRKINDLDNVIEKITDDKYCIRIRDFQNTKHAENMRIVSLHFLEYPEHFLACSEDRKKPQKILAEELGVRKKDIQRVVGLTSSKSGIKRRQERIKEIKESNSNRNKIKKEPKWKDIIKKKDRLRNIQKQNMKMKKK